MSVPLTPASRGPSCTPRLGRGFSTQPPDVPQPPTAIRMLCEEIQSATVSQQLTALQALETNWALLRRANIRPNDAKHFLAILFHLLACKDEGKEQLLVTESALRILYALLGSPNHPHFTLFLTAMRSLLDNLGLSDHVLYKRPSPPSKISPRASPDEDSSAEDVSPCPSPIEVTIGTIQLTPPTLYLDKLLSNNAFRPACVSILKTLDLAGINSRFFLREETVHLYLPHRFTGRAKVFRDFVQCTPTPRYAGPSGAGKTVHVKTNVPAKSDIMYRFHVEGFNYGNNSIINCDIVGYTHNRWEMLGQSEQYGWPEGWDKDSINHHASGAELSQYYSRDGFVTLRLQAASLFCVGFTVSAWLVCHGYGADFLVSATVHHQEADL